MSRAYGQSGDLAADRRFVWAAAAAREGDHAAAAELFEQALELAPVWAPAWFGLGEAREAMGDVPGAAEAYGRALAADPQDRLGAALRLARLAGETPAAPPAAYVRTLFDDYAPRFERHLVERLGYRGPDLLHDAVEHHCAATGRPMRFARMIDLGCGTGLVARRFAHCCAETIGCDLSPQMVASALAAGLYARAEAADVVAFLQAEPAGKADLVLAGDVYVYIGEPGPSFRAIARVLAPNGLFAATFQDAPSDATVLGADLRYAHPEPCLRRAAAEAGLRLVETVPHWCRKEHGREVPGLVALFALA